MNDSGDPADAETMLAKAREALARRDVDAGVEWLERAAATGDAEAMHLRADLAYKLKDNDAAFAWWGRAGAAGRLPAWRHAAVHATRLRDLDQAAEWWGKLAATGDGEAMYHLAVIALGRDDAVTGENWLKKSADAGQTDAMFTLGHRAREAGDQDGARRWWVAAMAAGDANAMAELVALPTPARHDVEEALAAVSSADVSEVYRFAGGWNSRQLAAIGDHLLAAEDQGERVLCLHLVLATSDRLGASARRFVEGAIALDVDEADFLGRWARALGLAHSDGKPHLVADYLTASSPIVG